MKTETKTPAVPTRALSIGEAADSDDVSRDYFDERVAVEPAEQLATDSDVGP